MAQSLNYTGELPPPRFNLARHCLAQKPAEKIALIIEGTAPARYTFGEIEDQVLRMAEGLRREGLERGSRIALCLPGSADFALSFFAANAAGLVPVPVSPALTRTERGLLLEDCNPDAVISDGTFAFPEGLRVVSPDELKRLPRGDYADTGCDDPAYMIYTSGSTARPKGVLHAQRAMWGRRPMYRGWYGISADDVVLHTGALNWTYTLGTGLCDPWANGASSVIYNGPPSTRIWQQLAAEHRVTIMASVPGLYRRMLREGFAAPPSLRHGLSAGEALPASILAKWRSATGLEIYEALGMTEISTYISSSPAVPVRPGSPGRVQPGRSVTILDDGRLAVHRSDPGLMLGYWNRPEEEREAWSGEWFAGGDTGRFDADGYFWHEGRANELLNAGGFRVSPIEVEAALLVHPSVYEAAAFELKLGGDASIIAALVVPSARIEPPDLLQFAAERLAPYKRPREIRLVASLPRTANGKLVRAALERMFLTS